MASAINDRGFTASQSRWRSLAEVGVVLAALIGVILLGRYAVGCAAERAALALPHSLDVRLGDAAANAVTSAHVGVAVSPSDEARVRTIFDELVATLAPEARASLGTPTVTLLHDETPNAFALPGGKVFVLTGLLDRVGGGAEGDRLLRGVLAHELGHAAKRHTLRLLARRVAFGVAIGLLMGNGDQLGDALLAGASQLEGLRNSREMESEADEFGVDLLVRGGHDPDGLARFLESLEAQPVPALLSTHPDPADRAAKIRERARR